MLAEVSNTLKIAQDFEYIHDPLFLRGCQGREIIKYYIRIGYCSILTILTEKKQILFVKGAIEVLWY